MVGELELTLPSFDGDRARSRCFAHTINLVVKSVLREFETKKGDSEVNVTHMNETDSAANASEAVNNLLGGEGGDMGDGDPDDIEDWRDERTTMSKAQIEALEAQTKPLRGMLGKVRIFVEYLGYYIMDDSPYDLIHTTYHIATTSPLPLTRPPQWWSLHGSHHYDWPPTLSPLNGGCSIPGFPDDAGITDVNT